MRLEIGLLFIGVVLAIRLLYEGRHLVGPSLPLWVAALLFYVPWLHNRLRRLGIRFFEENSRQLLVSLRFFLLCSLALFPGFLLVNHCYQSFILSRHFFWNLPGNLPRLLLTQLLLVSLPEEVFFRGWMQPLLRRRLGAWASLLATSLLFAFSHSVIALQWWHFAIFFPGCVFGWLREKTGAVTASILFHATSNLLMAWIAVSYR